jgi:hypothetical protein
MPNEAKILKDMKTLGITREEVLQMYADDKKIDKGAKLFEQNAQQKAVSKKMRQADRKPTAYKFEKRERKPNDEKRQIIDYMKNALGNFAGEVTVSNIERQVDFNIGDNAYSIQLICHRKPKV